MVKNLAFPLIFVDVGIILNIPDPKGESSFSSPQSLTGRQALEDHAKLEMISSARRL